MENNENLNNQVNTGSINQQVQSNNNSKVIITIMALIIVGLVGYIVYTKFIQKSDNPESKPNNTQEQGNNNQQQSNNTNSISVVKTLESFYFNVILDTNGNAYLGVRLASDITDNDTIANLFKNAKAYSYNGKTENLVKIDLQNIKDIQCINYGNGGGKYIIFLNQNNKLYALFDFGIIDKADLTPLTDDSLNNVSSVYPECDEGGCLVYANAIVNGKEEKVSLYDLFEK